MASSNHLTRKAKELRDTEGVPLSEAKRRLSATGSSYPWELLGITDLATYDPTPRWSQPVSILQLQVCAGADTAGTPIVVDLVDQRLGGQGPHWLIQTRPENDGVQLLTAAAADLAVRYSPHRLELAILDATGSALQPLQLLPHVRPGTAVQIPEEPSQWATWLHETSTRRRALLKDLGVTNYAQYQQLPPEQLNTVPELVVIANTGNDHVDLSNLDLHAMANAFIHFVICTPHQQANDTDYSIKLLMYLPQTAEQATQSWAQLRRENPEAKFVGEPSETPIGAGMLEHRYADRRNMHNFSGYPAPPILDLAARLRQHG